MAEGSFQASDATLDSQVIALQASGADVLVAMGVAQFGARAIRKLYDLGWKPTHYRVSVAAQVSATFIPAGVDKAVGVLSAGTAKHPRDPQWADHPGMKDCLSFMKACLPAGDPMGGLNVAGYNSAQILVQILRQCGDVLTHDNVMRQAPDGAPVRYERHRPELTTLYRLVQQHAATFIAQAEDAAGAALPQFVKVEFDAFLECGILAHGFLRLRCGDCGHDKLVAFSCKRRGFCPSCGARRMAQTAAHLVDHVIPPVPVRQWVLSLPIPLRLLLAAQPKLLTPVLQVVHRVITRFLLKQAGLKADEADSGAVTLIQRFGSAANLNIHLHCLVLDGVYRRGTGGAPAFVEVPAPTDEALQTVLHKIIMRMMKLLTRRGVLVEEEGSTYMADNDGDSDEARTLRSLQVAACTYRIAFGLRAGQKVLTVQGAMPRDSDFKHTLCADSNGFSLHAAARCDADDRQALEQLCRYITRPALANERVQTNAADQGVLKLKTAWRDGTTHLGMSPLEFMQRLAALVPRPRLHLIRFHGVLAPNAKLGALVVPQEAEAPVQEAKPAGCEANCAHHRPVRLSWTKLLKRVFEIDMEHCPNCGGELKIIAAILEQPVIEKILMHLGLQARAPPRASARGQALQAA